MRKICVFTGTRAEFGLLRRVMQSIQNSPDLTLQIVATGMHLSPEFGMTIQELREDGFQPDETVEILLSADTPTAVCKSMGLGLIGYGEVIQRLRPDIIVLLGDRFETFCVAAAAQVCRVPVAHIHGGETTEGAIDEAFRHCITKMSHLHFASCEEYCKRIVQMGESPERVFNVGALGVENIRKTQLMTRQELSESIGFTLDRPYFLVTFHPVTLEKGASEVQFQALLDALQNFPDYKVILTKTNADTDGRVINKMIDVYTEKEYERFAAFKSLGTQRYLSAMKYADVVIGNSSSGILESPSFRVPTVNIGDRQKGRIQAGSVLNCSPKKDEIIESIQRALSPDFKQSIEDIKNPYEKKNTAKNIKNIIKKSELGNIVRKEFYDIPVKYSLANSDVRAKP